MKLSLLRCKRGITEYNFVVRHSFSLLSVATIASVSLGPEIQAIMIYTIDGSHSRTHTDAVDDH